MTEAYTGVVPLPGSHPDSAPSSVAAGEGATEEEAEQLSEGYSGSLRHWVDAWQEEARAARAADEMAREAMAFEAARASVAAGVPSWWDLEALDPDSILARDARRLAGCLHVDRWAVR